MEPVFRKKISLEDLYLFELLASVGSISGVALRTELTQPAVTQKLTRLESQVGAALWVRKGRSLGEPTETGQRFLHYARNVLRETSVLFREIGMISDTQTLHIAASSIPAEYLLPRMLAGYQAVSHSSELKLTLAGSRRVCDMVESGAADIGFSGYVSPGFSGRAIAVAHDRIVPVISPECPLAKRNKPITFQELLSLPMIVRELESGTRTVLEESLDDLGIAIPSGHPCRIVGSAHALIEAVRIGSGFSFVSSFSVADLYVPEITGFPVIQRSFHLMFRNEIVDRDLIRQFVRYTREYFGAA